MLDACDRLQELVGRMSETEFYASRDARELLSWNLFVLGEAAKGVTDGTRSEGPGIPWREITGLRDVLVHGYFRVSYPRIWSIASSEVPARRTSASYAVGPAEQRDLIPHVSGRVPASEARCETSIQLPSGSRRNEMRAVVPIVRGGWPSSAPRATAALWSASQSRTCTVKYR